MSASGIATVAPARRARSKLASASSTYRCSVTGVLPEPSGPAEQPWKASASITVELPIRSWACMILAGLPGIGMRIASSAPKARL